MKHLWLFDKNKLLILNSLLICEDASGCDIREDLGIPKNLLSYHIKILREKGFLIEKKCGQRKKYSINPDKTEHVKLALKAVGIFDNNISHKS